MGLNDQLHELSAALRYVLPELALVAGIIIILVTGLLKSTFRTLQLIAVAMCLLSIFFQATSELESPMLFGRMLRGDAYSRFFNTIADIGAIVVFMITRKGLQKQAEYFLLLLAIVLGAHLLVMSLHFVMLILSLELISIPSYALANWKFDKHGAEGSLKYFLFGSVATAFMLYGISWIFRLAGTLDFSSQQFADSLIGVKSLMLPVAGIMILGAFLFKTASAPMHVWAPDVYQSTPLPVVAFLSVVPKLAGLAALIKYVLAMNLFGQSPIDWRLVLIVVSGLSIGVGNFSALWQTNPRRLLAYSSVAQAGFLLVGTAAMTIVGLHAVMFYAVVLLFMNFLTFLCLQQFEHAGVKLISDFRGLGPKAPFLSVCITIGLIALVGLPITAGFSAKLFVFSSLWEAYEETHKSGLVFLLIFGLLNTVISLFYYLRIPFYLFVRNRSDGMPEMKKTPPLENLLTLILVIVVLGLFFQPQIVMGWIIKINFVL